LCAGPVCHAAKNLFFEDNGELGFRGHPFTRLHRPRLCGVTQGEEKKFHCRVVVREVAACFHSPAHRIQTFNRVCCVDDPPYDVGKGEEGNDFTSRAYASSERCRDIFGPRAQRQNLPAFASRFARVVVDF
jgi:hypothetical protein